VFPTPGELAEIIDHLVWHQDEPFGSTSIFAQWCVFRRAAEVGLKVMLDGQGADEQLAGYHGSFAVHLSALIARKRYLEGLWTIYKRWLDHDVKIGPQLATYFGAFLPGRLRNLIAGPPPAAWPLERLLKLDAFSEIDSSQPPYLAAMKRNGLEPPTNLGLLCEGMVYTNLPLLLHFEDRNSMAHSVEARVPFLDHRLVDFSLGLGNSHKIVGSDTKRVLRRAMKHTLPERVLRRKDKLGFPTPEEVWFKGPLRPRVLAWIDEAIETFPDLIDAAGFRQMATEMLDGKRAFDFTLWRFVCFGIWGRVFSVNA
jgi:asparagine synthase (glutamine-hydrolysing)